MREGRPVGVWAGEVLFAGRTLTSGEPSGEQRRGRSSTDRLKREASSAGTGHTGKLRKGARLGLRMSEEEGGREGGNRWKKKRQGCWVGAEQREKGSVESRRNRGAGASEGSHHRSCSCAMCSPTCAALIGAISASPLARARLARAPAAAARARPPPLSPGACSRRLCFAYKAALKLLSAPRLARCTAIAAALRSLLALQAVAQPGFARL